MSNAICGGIGGKSSGHGCGFPSPSSGANSKSNPTTPSRSRSSNNEPFFPAHIDALDTVSALYNSKKLVRGKLRKVSFSRAYVKCDHDLFTRDILIETDVHLNRAMDGDIVYVEIISDPSPTTPGLVDSLRSLSLTPTTIPSIPSTPTTPSTPSTMWRDDPLQVSLWDPKHNTPLKRPISNEERASIHSPKTPSSPDQIDQPVGKVVCIDPPPSPSIRGVIGNVRLMDPNQPNGRLVLISAAKNFPKFVLPAQQKLADYDSSKMYIGDYKVNSWGTHQRWPSLSNLRSITGKGKASSVAEVETAALKMEFKVNHKEFNIENFPDVLKAVNDSVKAGMNIKGNWEPTASDCENRRDFRDTRIFTVSEASRERSERDL